MLTIYDNSFDGIMSNRVQKSFCLEMIESLLEHYSSLFVNIPQFNFLLKEKVCNIVIKLFSPGKKLRAGYSA